VKHILAALAVSVGLLAAPSAARAADEAPVYAVTSFPAHGVRLDRVDCAGAPSTDVTPAYRWAWDPDYQLDVVEIAAHGGSTALSLDVPSISAFSYWNFGTGGTGVPSVDIDFGTGHLRGVGKLTLFPHRGGEWMIHFRDTQFDWTRYDASHPGGVFLTRSNLEDLPVGYTGPARISLTLSDCAGATSGSVLRMAGWWLEGGPGNRWTADFGRAHRVSLTATTSRTSLTRSGTVVLSPTVTGLPAGVGATFELWRTVLYPPGGGRFVTPTWQPVRSVRVPPNGRARVVVTPTESSSYYWYVLPDATLIDSQRTAPVHVAVTPRLTLTAPAKRVARGRKVTVTGTLDGREHPRVTLYRAIGRRLIKVGAARTHTHDGRQSYTIRFTPRKAGTWRLVAVADASPQLGTATSGRVRLRVR
jgi:hypothetical protein